MNRYIKTYSFAALFMLACLLSCEEDYEQVTVMFYPVLEGSAVEPEANTIGVASTVKLRTSRVLAEDSKVNIRIEGNGAGYGNSYTTSPPQLQLGIITLTIPRGEVEASFTFTPKNDGVFIPTDYKYSFSIAGVDNDIRSIVDKNFAMNVKDNTAAFINESFATCPAATFVERVVSGPSTWACSGFGNPDEASANRCMEANAYGDGGTTGCNTYLVLSAPIDGKLYNNLFISAYVYSRFTGNGSISFVYSTNYSGTGNPEAPGVTWNELPGLNSKIPAAGTQVWTGVSTLLENVGDEPVYIAVHHTGGTTTSSSSWRIDDFQVKGN